MNSIDRLENVTAVTALRTFVTGTVLAGIGNPATREVYRINLFQFLDWLVSTDTPFSRAAVQSYTSKLREDGKAPATCNVALAGIKRLAKEAYYAGRLPIEVYQGVSDIKGEKKRTVRAAQWLTLRQVNELLSLPETQSLKGLRDRAILGVLVGCGLRRAELCELKVGSIEQRSGRWVLIVHGKGGKTRIVGVPPGLKVSIDDWIANREFDGPDGQRLPQNEINNHPLFFSFRKGGKPQSTRKLDPQSVQDVVQWYAMQMVPPILTLAPHDLRRTHARLAREAGTDLEQIQFALGHDSIETTAVYLGQNQKLDRTPGDAIDVDWTGGKI